MYVGQRVTQTSQKLEAREFHCRSCGYHGHALVVGVGQGQGNSAYFLDNQGASRRAQSRAGHAAAKNVAQTLRLARCPSCHQRDSSHVTTFWAGYLAKVVGAIAIVLGVGVLVFAITGFDPVVLMIVGGLSPVAGALVAWMERWRWTTVDARVHHVTE